jgi:hypothetical protein
MCASREDKPLVHFSWKARLSKITLRYLGLAVSLKFLKSNEKSRRLGKKTNISAGCAGVALPYGDPVGSSARGRPRRYCASWGKTLRPWTRPRNRASRRASRGWSGCATITSRPRAASSRTRTSGPAAARGRFTERGGVLLHLQVHTTLVGGYEDLLESEGGRGGGGGALDRF